MPESVKRRGSSGPTIGATVRRSTSSSVAMSGAYCGFAAGHPERVQRLDGARRDLDALRRAEGDVQLVGPRLDDRVAAAQRVGIGDVRVEQRHAVGEGLLAAERVGDA